MLEELNIVWIFLQDQPSEPLLRGKGALGGTYPCRSFDPPPNDGGLWQALTQSLRLNDWPPAILCAVGFAASG